MFTDFAAFISTDYIKKNFPNAKNIPDEELAYGIRVAQQKYMIDTLGSYLYNDITDKVFLYKNSGTTVPDNYTYLRDNYIANTLLHFAVLELIPTHYAQLTTIGIQQKSSEYSSSGEKTIILNLTNGVKNTAEFYNTRLLNHLCQNSTLYPLYNEWENDTDNVPSQEINCIGGMFLY